MLARDAYYGAHSWHVGRLDVLSHLHNTDLSQTMLWLPKTSWNSRHLKSLALARSFFIQDPGSVEKAQIHIA